MGNYDEELQQRAAEGDEAARWRIEQNRRYRQRSLYVPNDLPWTDLPDEDDSETADAR